VWGPSNVENISRSRWFVTFIDDCSRVTWVYLLKQMFEVTSVFLHFFASVKTQIGVSIKRVRSNNAKDYFNHEFNSFCQKEVLFTSLHVLKRPNKIGLLREKMGIC